MLQAEVLLNLLTGRRRGCTLLTIRWALFLAVSSIRTLLETTAHKHTALECLS